jgi:hypothetical protein
LIRHTVVFKLKHAARSAEEAEFLQSAMVLQTIPGVRKFERLRQTSKKNEYDFGFSMEFDSPEAYELYNAHPAHVDFVQSRWVREVDQFMEIDYEPYA